MRWLAVFACALASIAFAAPLTEAEKALLQSGMSEASATAFGKGGEAAGLARIIAIGDPKLVNAFDYGMAQVRIDVMPPDVEALVVKHFDDPKVGAQLRAHRARYATRALFDKHYARLQGAFRSDEPSFSQILRTDLAGIDEELLRLAPKWPVERGQPNGAVQFVARRKHPAAVPLLVASLDASFQGYKPVNNYHPVLTLLLDYPSADVWRQTGAEVERLRNAGRLTDDQYAAAHRQLDPLLKDIDLSVARVKSRNAFVAYGEKRDAIRPGASEIEKLRDSSPKDYVDAMARYLDQLESISLGSGDERVIYDVAGQWGALGVYARFQMRNPALAVLFLEKAAKGRDLVGQVVLAETYQLELRDNAKALGAYERALDTATNLPPGAMITPYARPGMAQNVFWREWLAAEVEYARSGKPFNGRVSEEAIGGFWEVVPVWATRAIQVLPEWTAPHPRPQTQIQSAPGYSGMGLTRPSNATPDWPAVGATLERIDAKDLAARLTRVPPSRFALLLTLRHISALPNADAILRELARNDPSGYWTTVALGTVAYHERSASARDEALRNGVADVLPGMAAAGKPNALLTAARRHLQTRDLRVVEKKP